MRPSRQAGQGDCVKCRKCGATKYLKLAFIPFGPGYIYHCPKCEVTA